MAVFLPLSYVLLTSSLLSCAQVTTTQRVSYRLTHKSEFLSLYGGLNAIVAGRTYAIESADPEDEEFIPLIQLKAVYDLDGDGYEEALLSYSDGGNASMPQYWAVSYRPLQDSFIRSDNLGSSWKEPDFSTFDQNKTFSLVEESTGFDQTDPERKIRHFQMNNGHVILMRTDTVQPIPAVVELSSEHVRKDPDEEMVLEVDLNGDGLKDTITGSYWMRWGIIHYVVEIAGEEVPALRGTTHRVGVLSTRTHGVHDLVVGYDELWYWDGQKYVGKGLED